MSLGMKGSILCKHAIITEKYKLTFTILLSVLVLYSCGDKYQLLLIDKTPVKITTPPGLCLHKYNHGKSLNKSEVAFLSSVIEANTNFLRSTLSLIKLNSPLN